jgi:hypothetical protein
MRGSEVSRIEDRLARHPQPGTFTAEELEGLPSAARRYFETAIAPGAPLAVAARLQMRGRIKIGRWWPFRAREVLSPHDGLVWRARAGGVVLGSDSYLDGAGVMDWKLAGLVTVVHADGADLSRSSAGRAGGEAMWVPTALLPRFDVAWSAHGAHEVTARFQVGTTPLEVCLGLDGAGQIESLVFDRWGDPDETGTWGWHPFGGKISGYRRFGAVTVPSAGHFGWFYGTDRWPDSESFRFEIRDLRLVTNGARS